MIIGRFEVKLVPEVAFLLRGMSRIKKRNMRILIPKLPLCSWKFLQSWVTWFCIYPQIFTIFAPLIFELGLLKDFGDPFYVPTKKNVSIYEVELSPIRAQGTHECKVVRQIPRGSDRSMQKSYGVRLRKIPKETTIL